MSHPWVQVCHSGLFWKEQPPPLALFPVLVLPSGDGEVVFTHATVTGACPSHLHKQNTTNKQISAFSSCLTGVVATALQRTCRWALGSCWVPLQTPTQQTPAGVSHIAVVTPFEAHLARCLKKHGLAPLLVCLRLNCPPTPSQRVFHGVWKGRGHNVRL